MRLRMTEFMLFLIVSILGRFPTLANAADAARRKTVQRPNIVLIVSDNKYYLLTDRYGDLQKYSVVLGLFRRVGMSDPESDYR